MDCPYPGYVYVDVDGIRALRLLSPSTDRTKREDTIGYKPDGMDPLIDPPSADSEAAGVTPISKDRTKEAVLKALADRAEVSAALGVIFIGSFLALFVLSHSAH